MQVPLSRQIFAQSLGPYVPFQKGASILYMGTYLKKGTRKLKEASETQKI